MRVFTHEELGRYDGAAGAPAFVACAGQVYDVSGSFLWRGGRHQAEHTAGHDLTDELAQAPHGVETLERFAVVGILVPKL
jgi:predicted heme/steroid binding protein